MIELLGLFLAAFLSASLFPFQSELLFIAMLSAGHYADWVLLAMASLGNTLGSTFNWWLGRAITHFEDKHWFPVKKGALAKAEQWFMRWGKWSLLLSWMPIIGDPLTMIAGILRVRLLPFLALVALAKTTRYFVIMTMIH